MFSPESGWAGLEGRADPADRDLRDLEIAFARCFAGEAGARVLRHLRSLTLDRHLGPAAGDAHLRHLEGQRQLVAHILAMIERGRAPEAAPPEGRPSRP